MKWKILLFIFLLAFLACLIYFKPLRLPTFSSITGFFSRLLSFQKPVYFQLYADSIKDQTFQLLNTSFFASGTCLTPITIGKVSIHIASMPCKIEIFSPSGSIKIDGKNVYVEANSPLMRINNVEYTSSEKISFQMNVNSLFASVFSQSLTLKNFRGKFEKFSDGSVSAIINFPPCESLELLDFTGSLQISNQTILLGSARASYWCENVKKNV